MSQLQRKMEGTYQGDQPNTIHGYYFTYSGRVRSLCGLIGLTVRYRQPGPEDSFDPRGVKDDITCKSCLRMAQP